MSKQEINELKNKVESGKYATKFKDHAEHEAELAVASVKTMGLKSLVAQVSSPRTSPAFKDACKKEIEAREAARKAILDKKAAAPAPTPAPEDPVLIDPPVAPSQDEE